MLSSIQGLKWQKFHRVKVPDVWSSGPCMHFIPASTSNKPLLVTCTPSAKIFILRWKYVTLDLKILQFKKKKLNISFK